MKKLAFLVLVFGLVFSSPMFAFTTIVHADTVGPIDFEGYPLGVIDGQDGWTSQGANGSGCAVYDHAVNSSLGTTGFSNKSLRISNAVTSGCFGDQTFAKPTTNAAGEADSTSGSYSVGTMQSHFEASLEIASTKPLEQQPGLFVSISPDRGDGSRMSYLGFSDGATGIDVVFYDVQGVGNPSNFVLTNLGTLNRTVPHTVKFDMDFYNGPSNDVVRIFLDGVLVHTGTSWENYYRYDSEASAEQSPRIVKTLILRTGGTAVPATSGNGFLFDNLSLMSGVITEQACSTINLVSNTSTQFKHLTTSNPSSSSADGSFTLGTPGAAVATGPDGFAGAWDTAINDPDVSGAIFVNNSSVAPSNPAGVGDGQNGTVDVWRLFSQPFTLPAGAIVSSAMLHLSADNSAEAFLDNLLVGSSPNYTTVSDISLPSLNAGNHELEFVVKNDAYEGATNPTAVIYKAVINYCVPTTPPLTKCPAAPAVAAAYLKDIGKKPGSTEGKNIISKVAQEMGAQTLFHGIGACNPAYRGEIVSYIGSL